MNPDPLPPESQSISASAGPPARIAPNQPRTQVSRSVPRPGTPPANGSGITPAFLWRVFCHWWKWTVPLGVILCLAAGAIVWKLHVPMYEGMALIKIESEAPFIAFENGKFSQDVDRYVQTQVELLRGPVVLGPVLTRQEIASMPEIQRQVDPLKYLQDELTVKQIGKSELYQVSYLSGSPQDAATVANVVVAEYLLMQDREDRQRSQIVIDVLEKERLERGTKVEQLRQKVVNLAKDLTGKDPFGQGAITDVAAFSPAASIYQSLTEADVGFEVLKAELQALMEAPILAADKMASTGFLELEISNRADVRQLEARIAEITEVLAQIKSKPRTRIGDSWEQDPDYLRLQEHSTLAKSELNALKTDARKELLELRGQERKHEQERLIATKEQEIASLQKKRDMLKAKFDSQLEELKSGGAQSAELEFARAELEREQKVFELIAARKLALQTEMRAPARVSSMRTASVPSVALNPIPYKVLLITCLLSLLAPFGLALGREALARRIHTQDELYQESHLPVLGEIARFPLRQITANQQQLPVAQQRELFVYAESIDSLRTRLMLTENIGAAGQKRIIAICSAASGEGKTSVATSLAMSIAEATKQPTLIIDADLRAPDIAKFLDVPNHPGISDVLCNKTSLSQAIHRVGSTQAYVMPAGQQRVNPHHILHGSKVPNLLTALRKEFSTIIIDTPPILSASESLIYARSADLVVYCSLAEVSRAKPVRTAIERLQATGANLAGAVLSGVAVDRYVYHYGAYIQDSETS